ncbi:hypothetical protein SeMB42_g04980 [Synchytrium endobioticum]|uniref:ABC-2 type transporter transmembrane domain-containing protein n=1 Tax=Synchytrium endobioticum TaxID=286115 RepID=A0A507CUR1_9FUNG|nr:hypothetical protein SeMB42_g04980 [Synchytrium endobioticum]
MFVRSARVADMAFKSIVGVLAAFTVVGTVNSISMIYDIKKRADIRRFEMERKTLEGNDSMLARWIHKELDDTCTTWADTPPPAEAIAYFTSINHPVPPLTNPGDHFLDITAPDTSIEHGEISAARIEKLIKHWRAHHNHHKFPPFGTRPAVPLPNPSAPRGIALFCTRCALLATRNLRIIHRDRQSWFSLIVQTIVVVVLFGWLFWHIGTTQASIKNRLGILFFLALERFLTSLFRVVRILPAQRPLIVRERSKSMYSASELYIVKLATDILTVFAQHLVILTALYFMIGLQVSVAKYTVFIGIGALLALVGHSLGYLLSAISPSVDVGLVTATLLSSVYGMFSGNLIIPSKIPIWLRWITYTDPLYYTFSAWSQNEFSGLVFPCADPRCIPNGETVLAMQDIQEVTIAQCAIVLTSLWVLYTFVGYFAIRVTTSVKTVKSFM